MVGRGVVWRGGAVGVYMQRVHSAVHDVMLILVMFVMVTLLWTHMPPPSTGRAMQVVGYGSGGECSGDCVS